MRAPGAAARPAGAARRPLARLAAAAALGACSGACDGAREEPAALAPSPVVERLGVHEGGVLALVALPDGRVLSSGADGVVRLWERAGTEAARFDTPGATPVASLAAADSGHVVLVPAGAGVLVWDATTRAERTRLAGAAEPSRVAIASDAGTAVAAGADGGITVWTLPDGSPTRRLRPHAGRVVGLAVVGTGGARSLLTAGDDDRLCADMLDGRSPRCVEVAGEGVTVVAFSTDGRRAASGNRVGEVRLWDAASGAALGTVNAHEGEVTALAFTPDGRRVVSGGADRQATLIDVAADSVVRRLLTTGSYVSAVAATATDGVLVGGDDGVVARWRP